MPRANASDDASSIFTGVPASAKHIAMPPPMVPAPITAAVATLRTGVSFARPGIRANSRSAKKA